MLDPNLFISYDLNNEETMAHDWILNKVLLPLIRFLLNCIFSIYATIWWKY